MSIRDVFNYKEINSKIAIAGQPTLKQIPSIDSAGYESVIQLIVDEANYVMLDEKQRLGEVGIEHDAMTLSFANPKQVNVDQFIRLMKKNKDKKTLVHCAAGFCTTGLMIIYLMREHDKTFEEAREMVLEDWQPSDVWQRLIDANANNN